MVSRTVALLLIWKPNLRNWHRGRKSVTATHLALTQAPHSFCIYISPSCPLESQIMVLATRRSTRTRVVAVPEAADQRVPDDSRMKVDEQGGDNKGTVSKGMPTPCLAITLR